MAHQWRERLPGTLDGYRQIRFRGRNAPARQRASAPNGAQWNGTRESRVRFKPSGHRAGTDVSESGQSPGLFRPQDQFSKCIRKRIMNNENITALLLRRYALAQTPLGQFLLSMHVQQQRLRARWLANGSDAAKRLFDIFASFALLIALSPVFLLTAVLVWI